MPPRVRDYSPLLEQAIAEARAAGLGEEATELETMCFSTAYTTSSELLQEHYLAMQTFLRNTEGRLPQTTARKVRVCMNETELVCAGWRGLVAWVRRPRVLG